MLNEINDDMDIGTTAVPVYSDDDLAEYQELHDQVNEEIEEEVEETEAVSDEESTIADITNSDISEDTAPDIQQQQEAEEEDWYYPDYIPDEYVAPEFKDEKDELEWYREKYYNLMDEYRKPEFSERMLDMYEKDLLAKETEIDSLKAVRDLFKGNPTLAAKLFMPDLLARNNIPGEIESEEARKTIHEVLVKNFGKDYANKFNEDERDDPDTLSGKMWAKQEQVIAYLENERERAKGIYNANRQLTPEEVAQALHEEYDTHYKDIMDMQQYQNYVTQLSKATTRLLPHDVEVIMYKDEIIKEAYERGLKDGKRGVVKQIEQAGGRTYKTEEPPQRSNQDMSLDYDRFKGINNLYNYFNKD